MEESQTVDVSGETDERTKRKLKQIRIRSEERMENIAKRKSFIKYAGISLNVLGVIFFIALVAKYLT